MRTYGVTRWLGTWAARALSMLLAMAALTAACGDDDAAGGDAGGESGAHADHDGGDPGDSGGGHAGDGLAGAGGGGADGGVAHGDAGGSGTGGDDGGMMSCNCPSGSACLVVTCSPAGSCEEQNVDDGEPIDDQTAGDCNQVVCDGEGDTRNEPEAEGTECDVDDGVMCDGDGHCVQCLDEGDCDGSDVCQSGSCVPETCMNEDQDGDETDEDCGGPDCDPCGPDLMCVDDDDCAGGDCGDEDTCVPNCSDEEQNNDEVDVDCGPGCGTCGDDRDCSEDEHCTSGICIDGTCGLNGCTVANTMDRTGMGTTTIAASPFMYTPPCIEVSVGSVPARFPALTHALSLLAMPEC